MNLFQIITCENAESIKLSKMDGEKIKYISTPSTSKFVEKDRRPLVIPRTIQILGNTHWIASLLSMQH
jgi:hypothetical protein